MSDPKTDQRGQEQNPDRKPDITNIPDEVDLSIYDIDLSEPFGFGDGSLLKNPIPDPGGSGYSIGQNPIGDGAGTQRVADLQRMLIAELDGSGAKDQPSSVLPKFGVDGVWRCETQQAFNNLIKQKGLQDLCNSGGKTVADIPDVKQKSINNCGGLEACQVTQEIIDALKEKKKEESIVFEDAEAIVKPRDTIGDQCFLIKNLGAVIKGSVPAAGVTFHEATEEQIFDRTKLKFKNIHKIQTQDPATIMNRLRLTKGSLELLNIRHWQLSQLVPMVRIYKQYYDKETRYPREVEMEFSTFVDPVKDLQAMLENQNQRGVGIGIESFKFSYEGVQPETTKADIRATLSIHAQNFNELFKVRQGVDQNGKPIEGGYRIIDLIVQQPRSREAQDNNTNTRKRVYNPNFYEIKIKAGWAATGGGGVLSDDLVSALKDNQAEMFLGYLGHDFNFKDNGTVKLTIDFRARIETVLLDKRSDILFDPQVQKRRDQIENKITEIVSAKSKLEQEKKNDCEDGSVEQLQRLYNRNLDRERERSYLSLLKELVQQGCIYTVELSERDLQEELESVQAASDAAVEAGDVTAIENIVAAEMALRGRIAAEGDEITSFTIKNYSCQDGPNVLDLATAEPGIRRINYFFLGDLIALAVNNVLTRRVDQTEELRKINFGNLRFMLPPSSMYITNNRTNSKENVNVTDIPISVELFTDFLNQKIIKARKNSYPLLNFIKDVIKDLVFESMAPDCLGGEQHNIVNLDSAVISADSAAGNQDPVALRIEEDGNSYLDLDKYAKNLAVPPEESQGIFGVPGALRRKTNPTDAKFVFESFNRKSLSDSYEYIVIYPYNIEPRRLAFDPNNSEFKSRYERDLSNGIFHLTTGLDRGLVKSMSFSKTDLAFIREARYFQLDGQPDLQLSNVYNCNVEMYGNNLFFPGVKVYINPRGLGSDAIGDPGTKGTYANTMGLGGYHGVIRTEHLISRSGYSVSFNAMFETSGDGIGSFIDRQNKIGDSVIMECSDIEKQIDSLAAELGGSIKRSGGS